MQPWMQIYDPLGNLWLSSLVAALPIFFFFIALAVLRMKGHIAGTITVAIALAVAIFFYKMPVEMALASAGYGFLYGLWPIAWIIIAAVFLYKITVKTGQFDIIRASVVSITDDQRLQMLLVGFSFGAFLEGAAGFGAPVAITAALLVGLGFNPLYAAGLCLIANTAPVAFGAMGIPIIVGGQVTGIDPFKIGQMAGRQLPLLSVIVPFWLVAMMDGWRGIKETWPAIIVAGLSFAVTQYFTANFIGPELPDITSALVSLVSLTVFLKNWKPKNIFRFDTQHHAELGEDQHYSLGQIAKALRVSAEVLYIRAGILEPAESNAVRDAVINDIAITERQKQSLLDIYASFLRQNELDQLESAPAEPPPPPALPLAVVEEPTTD